MIHSIPLSGWETLQGPWGKHWAVPLTGRPCHLDLHDYLSIWVWSVLGRISVCVCGSLALCYLVKAQMITILLSISQLRADQGEKLLKLLPLYCCVLAELSNKLWPLAGKGKYWLDWTCYSHTLNSPPALFYFLTLRLVLEIWWIGPIFPLSDHEFLNFLLSPFEKCGSVVW